MVGLPLRALRSEHLDEEFAVQVSEKRHWHYDRCCMRRDAL